MLGRAKELRLAGPGQMAGGAACCALSGAALAWLAQGEQDAGLGWGCKLELPRPRKEEENAGGQAPPGAARQRDGQEPRRPVLCPLS